MDLARFASLVQSARVAPPPVVAPHRTVTRAPVTVTRTPGTLPDMPELEVHECPLTDNLDPEGFALQVSAD